MLKILGPRPANVRLLRRRVAAQFPAHRRPRSRGLALPQLLGAEAAAGIRSAGNQHKAVIMIFLPRWSQPSGHVRPQAGRPGRRSAANSGPSPRTSPESRFASTCPGSPSSPTSIRSSAPSSAAMGTTTPCSASPAATAGTCPRRLAGDGFGALKLQGAVDPIPPFVGLAPEDGPRRHGPRMASPASSASGTLPSSPTREAAPRT
jgi:hypothetical protein